MKFKKTIKVKTVKKQDNKLVKLLNEEVRGLFKKVTLGNIKPGSIEALAKKIKNL